MDRATSITREDVTDACPQMTQEQLESSLMEMDRATSITREDVTDACPQMTQDQLNMVFRHCKDEMTFQASANLSRSDLLKVSASVKMQLDEANQSIVGLAKAQDHTNVSDTAAHFYKMPHDTLALRLRGES